VAALGVRARGPERVFALLLPSATRAAEPRLRQGALREAAHRLRGQGRRTILDAAGCYQARNEAVREVVPSPAGDAVEIVLASDPLSSEALHS